MTAAMLGYPGHLDWNRALALGTAMAINVAALGALVVMQPSWEPTALVADKQVMIADWILPPPPVPDVPLAPPRGPATASLPLPAKPAVRAVPVERETPLPLDAGIETEVPAQTSESTPSDDFSDEGAGETLTRDAGVALPNPSSPPYPAIAVRKRMEGTVLLEIMVDANGAATDVRVIRGSGHRELDRSARDHVLREWSFQPALREGRPVAARVRVPIEFSLAQR